MGIVYRKNRVREHTAGSVNERIRLTTDAYIEHYGRHPELIPRRLRELDEEWDIERTLEANAATLSLAGLVLGILVSRRFLLLPLIVAGFLLQHSIQGWCPPVPVFRRLGVRTADEILRERTALEVLQGGGGGICESRGQPAEERIRTVIEAL